MHGTSVNDKKIPTGKDVSIRSGDILTFGNEVTRGSGMSTAHCILLPIKFPQAASYLPLLCRMLSF